MRSARLHLLTGAATALIFSCSLPALTPGSAIASPHNTAMAQLTFALRRFVRQKGGPPGISVVVQRGGAFTIQTAGVANAIRRAPFRSSDHMRLASVSKAFSGAAALALVSKGVLHLGDTVGRWLPAIAPLWSSVTLEQLLRHTSGIPDFSKSRTFQEALGDSLLRAPLPAALVGYVSADKLEFTPGSRFQYSNSDNILVGLIVEAATGRPYAQELQKLVFGPLGLRQTSLPSDQRMPAPAIRGYGVSPGKPPEDLTELFAAGWTWASGGIVSTPADANRFVRAYARGAGLDSRTLAAQRRFVPGSSEPPGPGTNSAGLGIFRYVTPCGTVYGHTGNTAGYTQFAAASADGRRSTVVSINAQITPAVNAALFPALRRIDGIAVCAALGR
jgi:D-alanyl-D-alanine carboxypeptidase